MAGSAQARAAPPPARRTPPRCSSRRAASSRCQNPDPWIVLPELVHGRAPRLEPVGAGPDSVRSRAFHQPGRRGHRFRACETKTGTCSRVRDVAGYVQDDITARGARAPARPLRPVHRCDPRPGRRRHPHDGRRRRDPPRAGRDRGDHRPAAAPPDPRSVRRAVRPDGRGRPWGNPVVGLRNAVAPPLVSSATRRRGGCGRDFHLGAAYEGPPGLRARRRARRWSSTSCSARPPAPAASPA